MSYSISAPMCSPARIVRFSGLENHYGEVPIAQEIHGRGRKLDDGVWGVESPTRLLLPSPSRDGARPMWIISRTLRAQKKEGFPSSGRESWKSSQQHQFLIFVVSPSHSSNRLSRRVGILKISLLCCFHVSLRDDGESRGRGSAH